MAVKKSLCKVTQRRKYQISPTLQFLYHCKGIKKQHLSREKSKWSKPPPWEHKEYIYFLVTIKVNYNDFFLCWIRCLTWDKKYRVKQHMQKSNMNWAGKKRKKNNLIGLAAFPCQWEGCTTTKRAALGIRHTKKFPIFYFIHGIGW